MEKMELSFLADAVFMAIGDQIKEKELLATKCPVCTPAISGFANSAGKVDWQHIVAAIFNYAENS